ncbi:MAG: hypothetical protein ACLRFK_01250 [Alphaproteobacteria bacterium]
MKRILLFLSALFIATTAIAHTINWYVDGNIFHTTTCESGENVTPPTAPEKYGYTFQGWDAYFPIEYLESTGTQYIDTGYVPNAYTGVKTKIQTFGNSGTDSIFFGSVYNFASFIWNGTLYFSFGDVRYTKEKIYIDDIIEYDWNKHIVNYSINGAMSTPIVLNAKTFIRDISMYIFSSNQPGYTYNTKMRLFYFQIYDNDVLVRDFIPVLDKYGVPCMYDKVERKYYYNAGTGDFIAGPIIGE